MRTVTAAALAVAGLAGHLAAAHQAQPAIGYVLSLSGPWQVNGRAVTRGEGVPAGAHLTLAPSARFDAGQEYALSIILLNNRPVGCASAETCRAGVTVPGSLNETASLSQKLSKVFARIFTAPDRWVGLVSRGAASPLDLSDHVVAVKTNEFAIGALIGNPPPGRYRLTFVPMADEGAAVKAVAVPIVWTGGAQVMAIDIPNGLYAVTLAPDAPNARAGREAWFLITDGDHFGAASGAFADARVLVSAWGPDVPPNDVTRFLHAYLAEIAATIR